MGERHRVLPGRLYAYIYAERHIVLPAEKERNGTQKKLQILKKTFLEKDYFKNISHSEFQNSDFRIEQFELLKISNKFFGTHTHTLRT